MTQKIEDIIENAKELRDKATDICDGGKDCYCEDFDLVINKLELYLYEHKKAIINQQEGTMKNNQQKFLELMINNFVLFPNKKNKILEIKYNRSLLKAEKLNNKKELCKN